MKNNKSWKEKFYRYRFALLISNTKPAEAEKILLKHMPDKLYKYRCIDCNSFHILQTGCFWASVATRLNDPNDCKFIYRSKDKIHEPTIKNNIENMRKTILVCSFSTIMDNRTMWNKYADESQGFCVEIDIKNASYKKYLLPVIYKDKPVDLTCEMDISNIYRNEKLNHLINSDFIRKAVIIKTKKWAYEKEWRFAFPNDKNHKKGCYIKFGNITSVYLGRNISNSSENAIRAICSLKGYTCKKQF